MRVLVVGAYGLIGGYIVSELLREGHDVIGAGRDIARAARRFPQAAWVRADLAAASTADWRGCLQGVDAVVNCAGALQDSPSDRLRDVHVEGLKALATAARVAGVARFIHISAVGVGDSAQPFGQTKFMGEQVLSQQDLAWIILRPGLVVAPAAFGGTALLRGLAAFPWRSRRFARMRRSNLWRPRMWRERLSLRSNPPRPPGRPSIWWRRRPIASAMSCCRCAPGSAWRQPRCWACRYGWRG